MSKQREDQAVPPLTPAPPGRAGLSTAQWSLRAVLAVACLGLLTWAWRTSEMDPGVLVRNADNARQYLFGRELDGDEAARLRDRAERTALLSLEGEVPGGAPPTPGAARDVLPDGEWDRRVERVYERMARDARGGYFPPESRPERVRGYTVALLETLAIAIWGTLIAVVAAVPASFLGARRSLEIIAPGRAAWRRGLRWGLCFVARRAFDVCRGFNEFVLALVLVAIIGLGPFAGVIALAVHTFGVLGKVFADAIESVRSGEIEGVTATGATAPQVLSFAVMPQIMPFVVSQSLLRFESNVRSASVLGIVGAGGIGLLIDDKLKSYEYREVAAMMILIIAVVSVIDFLCGRIMKKFV